MKILSLFSGASGLDLGLIQAGNTVIWANDIDVNAVETYKRNIGNDIILDDIKHIDITTLPEADVVVGGFPCQGFSQANRFRMLDDERNSLYRFFCCHFLCVIASIEKLRHHARPHTLTTRVIMTASTGTVHALTNPIDLNCLPIQLTRVLAAAIRMQGCAPEHRGGNHGVIKHLNTQRSPHIRIHRKSEHAGVITVKEC